MANRRAGTIVAMAWIDLSRSPDEVAPLLLGAIFRHGPVAVRLTEVEAYLGLSDPASHAFRGPTPRARVMFGPPAHLYVYLSHGIHLAGNIVCHGDGVAGAVLLRAGEVVEGVDIARERRGGVPDVRLARGPGCLGQALGFQLADSGAAIGVPDTGSQLADHGYWLMPPSGEPRAVRIGPRVGVGQAKDEPLRFHLAGEPTVSAYRRR